MCRATGNPPFQRSDSEVERRKEYLVTLKQALPSAACGILPEMIVNCLDNDPSIRPSAEKLISALGKKKTAHLLLLLSQWIKQE